MFTKTIYAQSVRGVGCKRGYPYFATGLYRVAYTRDGRAVWKLVRSGGWHRTTRIETCGRFENAIEINVRHNDPVAPEHCQRLRG